MHENAALSKQARHQRLSHASHRIGAALVTLLQSGDEVFLLMAGGYRHISCENRWRVLLLLVLLVVVVVVVTTHSGGGGSDIASPGTLPALGVRQSRLNTAATWMAGSC